MSKQIKLPSDKNLIAFCGIDCSKCFSYKMAVSEAAKLLRRELRAVKLKNFWKEIPFLGKYEPFKKSLDGLAMLRCPRGCRGGGGNPWCKIKKCCQKKSFWSCAGCELMEACDKLAVISKGYKNENLKNLKGLNRE
jgi:hypothetical protein